MKMKCQTKEVKFALPFKYRKYERWIRRLQHEYFCGIEIRAKTLSRCNCIWKDKPKPYIRFWTCSDCIDRVTALWLVILRGYSLG